MTLHNQSAYVAPCETMCTPDKRSKRKCYWRGELNCTPTPIKAPVVSVWMSCCSCMASYREMQGVSSLLSIHTEKGSKTLFKIISSAASQSECIILNHYKEGSTRNSWRTEARRAKTGFRVECLPEIRKQGVTSSTQLKEAVPKELSEGKCS